MNYRRETYHRAVDLFDRIMTIFDFKNSAKTDINFIGVLVVFIASKLEVDFFPRIFNLNSTFIYPQPIKTWKNWNNLLWGPKYLKLLGSTSSPGLKQ